MAARNPTSYTNWINESEMSINEPIVATQPDNVLNDQEFVLDQPVLVVSCSFWPMELTSASFVQLAVFWARCKDMCDVAGVTNNEIECDFYVKAMLGYTGSGNVRLQSNATTNTTSVATVTATSMTWHQGDTINLRTNDLENQLVLSALSGSGEPTEWIRVTSIGIVARLT